MKTHYTEMFVQSQNNFHIVSLDDWKSYISSNLGPQSLFEFWILAGKHKFVLSCCSQESVCWKIVTYWWSWWHCNKWEECLNMPPEISKHVGRNHKSPFQYWVILIEDHFARGYKGGVPKDYMMSTIGTSTVSAETKANLSLNLKIMFIMLILCNNWLNTL